MPRTVLSSPRGYEEPLEHEHQIVPWVEPLRPDSRDSPDNPDSHDRPDSHDSSDSHDSPDNHDSHDRPDSHDSHDNHDSAVGETPPSFVIHKISSAQGIEN